MAKDNDMSEQIEQLYTQVFDALVERELPVKRLKKSVAFTANGGRIVLDIEGVDGGRYTPRFEIREMRSDGGYAYAGRGLGRLHGTVDRGYRHRTQQFRSKKGVFPVEAFTDAIEAAFRRGIEEYNNDNASGTAMKRVRALVKKVLGIDLDDYHLRHDSPVDANTTDGEEFRVELNLNPRQLAHVAAQLDNDTNVRFVIRTDESRLNRIIEALGGAK
jgi:hypothetical protein